MRAVHDDGPGEWSRPQLGVTNYFNESIHRSDFRTGPVFDQPARPVSVIALAQA